MVPGPYQGLPVIVDAAKIGAEPTGMIFKASATYKLRFPLPPRIITIGGGGHLQYTTVQVFGGIA
jgi:hypothetical protein